MPEAPLRAAGKGRFFRNHSDLGYKVAVWCTDFLGPVGAVAKKNHPDGRGCCRSDFRLSEIARVLVDLDRSAGQQLKTVCDRLCGEEDW